MSTTYSNSHPLWLSPSILSADFAKLGEEVRALEAAGANMLHFDVMDNHYVPNLTMGPMFCKALRPHVTIPIDVHLMVEPVDDLIMQFAKAGANYISFHPEASRHVDRSLQLIKDAGCKAALALNPATSLNCLDFVMDKLDMVLLMSVNPGFGGQAFIESILAKIVATKEKINNYRLQGGQSIRLQVDGGVNSKNIGQLALLGVDTFVAGSAVFGAPDPDGGYKNIIKTLHDHAQKGVN